MEGRLSGLSVTLLAASLSKVIFTSLSLSFLQGEKLHFKIESYSNSVCNRSRSLSDNETEQAG